jgi:hypothetical protein
MTAVGSRSLLAESTRRLDSIPLTSPQEIRRYAAAQPEPRAMSSTDAVPSKTKVLDTYVGRHKKRTQCVLFTENVYRDNLLKVKVTAEDVARRFLNELLLRGGYKKKTLAPAMGTSRGHLDVVLRDGNLLMDHITALSAQMKVGPHVVFRALATIAEMMHDESEAESIQKTTGVDDELPGRADRRAISAETIENSETEDGDADDAETDSQPQPILESRNRNSSKPR